MPATSTSGALKGTGTRYRNAGRKKGIPNKVTASIKSMIEGALMDAGGQEYLTQQAKENPSAFLMLVGKILPKEIKAEITDNTNPRTLTDEQIISALASLGVVAAKTGAKESSAVRH